MTDVQEGFCETCAAKHCEVGDEPAALCGHTTHLKGMRFCVACAAHLGVCRYCGLSFRSTHKEKTP